MKLHVLTPSRGTISNGQKIMLLRLGHVLDHEGHHLSFKDNGIPGLLNQSREVLLSYLAQMDPETDRGLWLDADMNFDVWRILWAMRRPEQIIAWNYPIRIAWDHEYPPEHRRLDAQLYRSQPFRLWTASPKIGAGGRVQRSRDGKLVELLQCGFGAVLMHPAVAKDMHDAFGPHQLDGDSRLPISQAFEPLPPPEPRCSEDVSFWRRLKARGHRIWCDPVPYVTNGESGGCFADEIRLREATLPYLFVSAWIS